MWSRSDLESSSEDKGSVAGYKPREDGTEGGKGFIKATTKRTGKSGDEKFPIKNWASKGPFPSPPIDGQVVAKIRLQP
jgi:hypothetical protein